MLWSRELEARIEIDRNGLDRRSSKHRTTVVGLSQELPKVLCELRSGLFVTICEAPNENLDVALFAQQGQSRQLG
jgi:hypothetical protein